MHNQNVLGCVLAALVAPLAFAADGAVLQREFRDFAMRTPGNPQAGKLLFETQERTACARCHTVDGSRAKAGPDLAVIGDKFPRGDLVRALLEPSAEIAIGYETIRFEMKDEELVEGIIKQATDETFELIGAEGLKTVIKKQDVLQQQASRVSMMPGGWESVLTRQEFADLVAYLESLKAPANALAAASGVPDEIARTLSPAAFVPFFAGNIRFDHPVWFGEVPGSTNRWIVLEHFGKSWMVVREHGRDSQRSFVDLSRKVRTGGATGLLGFAFHPKFAENRKYFIKYQILQGNQISTVVDQRQFAEDFSGDDGEEGIQILKVPAVTQDHNGGCIEFGPDGYLYIGMGDSGPQTDPRGHGQDLGTHLGKILRIDVDHVSAQKPYQIPVTNPFKNTPGARPEIWAYGFREPWRFSWDRETLDLWVGDVGQDRFEEVSIVRAGENMGWNVYEGFVPFSRQYRREGVEYVPPIMSYARRHGVSVTGGYVYRGSKAPQMKGWYICGDFESRRIWALQQAERRMTRLLEIALGPTRVVSFSEGKDGELFLVGYDSGLIYHVDLSGIDTTPVLPRSLLATSEKAAQEYRYTTIAPANNWFNPGFDHSNWSIAPGGFGTEGTPGAVVRTVWRSNDIWLRREFFIDADRTTARPVYLRIHHDEDAEVYINGVEAARLARWTTGYIDLPISEEALNSLRPGSNIIAIHCHQNGGGQYIDAGLIEYVPEQKGQ